MYHAPRCRVAEASQQPLPVAPVPFGPSLASAALDLCHSHMEPEPEPEPEVRRQHAPKPDRLHRLRVSLPSPSCVRAEEQSQTGCTAACLFLERPHPRLRSDQNSVLRWVYHVLLAMLLLQQVQVAKPLSRQVRTA